MSRWVSADERLPESLVLVNIPNRDYLVAQYDERFGWWSDEHGHIDDVTHWMELPDPPEVPHGS